MGVPTFFKWLCVKYPKVLKDAVEPEAQEVEGEITVPVDLSQDNPNGEFDNLYLDMNGIIHPCCHPEDADSPETEEQMFTHIFAYIDRLIGVVRPRKLLYMAIDGVAPRAKMNQQRMRRFKAAAEVDQEEVMYNELKEQFESEGRSIPPPKTHWDSNVITPGTPFFDNLTRALRYYINQKMSTDPSWRGLKVILSDASCPGEGEHKIMQYIRSQRTYPEYNPNQRHCLYGADADLIMLGLATHEPHFTIMREAVLDAVELRRCYLCGRLFSDQLAPFVQTGHVATECTGEPADPAAPPETPKSQKSAWKPLQFLKIPILREYLENEFSFVDAPNFEPDFERCVDDFVLMCFFVGNDFLPHLPSLSIQKGSIDQMILLYQKILPLMADYLTNAGKINLHCLQVFVDHLGKVEEIVFQEEMKRQTRMKANRVEDEARVAVRVAEREAAASRAADDDNFAALRKLKGVEGKTEEAPKAKRQKVTHEGSIDDFKAQMRSKHKAATELENPVDDIELGKGGRKEWRFRYYKQKFHLTDEDIKNLDEFATRVATSYAEGLSWVLAYYYQGVCSWEWYYPFHYAPFASDISNFGLEKKKVFNLGQPFKPFEQLMAVFPARSGHCLPPILARLMVDPKSPIIDFYPKKFKEDPDGKRYSWQWVVLLPFIDQKRLLNAIRPLEKHLTPAEAARNSRGSDRVFVSQFHSLAQQIALVQTGKAETERHQKVLSDLGDCLCGDLSFTSAGFVSGAIINAGPESSTDLFPPLSATCLSCEFTCKAAHSHVCRFLPGSTPPEKILQPMDLQADPSRDRRFNAGAAKRIIMGSLGRLGVVDKQTVDQFFCHPRDNAPYNTQGVHSDNRYQAEMFGSRPSHKRGRPDDFNQQDSFPSAHRSCPDGGGGFSRGGRGGGRGGYNRQDYNQNYNQNQNRYDSRGRQYDNFSSSHSSAGWQQPSAPPSVWSNDRVSFQGHAGRPNAPPLQHRTGSAPPWMRNQRDSYK